MEVVGGWRRGKERKGRGKAAEMRREEERRVREAGRAGWSGRRGARRGGRRTFMHPGCGQRNGRSLEWVRSCRVRSARSTKPLPQPSIWHTHGFSPVWIR